ncbi:MAG: triose-phosphate isomerase [Lentisphaerae bacterium RIFOXYC12_FULL_60_16]|nr:MAG: triose-phosphate isomerase [Lentisphaerae bacterium RIFOXYC12_FULL_60_16]OGV84397.1 MAG: triose-phosphate isomerase [Lentisphaerae bacterium RIFOXYB12_FULL_60_10]
MVVKFRKKIVAGNWKMNKSVLEARDLATGIVKELDGALDVDVVLCPPFTALKTVGEVLMETAIKLGAQNMHWEASGAFTGEVSPAMLRDLYCHYVIVGHSERRQFFSETDETVNRKVKAAQASNLTPIVCVGETLQERQGGQMKDVVRRQLERGLAGVDLRKLIVAYEPVWAIGTGVNASPDQAQEMHACIRSVLSEIGGNDLAQSVRIQYGGSMKPSNAKDLLAQPDIDGGLIGGAALEARSFVDIVRAGG